MSTGRYFSAEETARELGVKPATVYAYVSRGLIRSESTGKPSRERRYLAEDVRNLKERKARGRSPAAALKSALDWGAPLMNSALTLITEQGVFYRGVDATHLAERNSLEEVASLLWTGDMGPEQQRRFHHSRPLPTLAERAIPRYSDLRPIERMQAVIPLLAAGDLAAHDHSPGRTLETGMALLQSLAAAAVGTVTPAGRVARTLSRTWARRRPEAERLMGSAMVLCADHGLNTSTLAARCAASTHASLYGVVSAGMATLQGTRHGGSTERVEAMLLEAAASGDPGQVVAARLRRGEHIPGFHHPLYPEGDPRAATLLAIARREYPDAPELELSEAIVGQVETLLGRKPNVDFALATLSKTLHLPDGAALALFALGRSVGWVAHAIEQYAEDALIRPRARYVGPPAPS